MGVLVETRAPGGAWGFVQDTTATKVSLSGFTPGANVTFRVIASKNGMVALPSPIATIYPAAAPSSPVLRLAA